MFMYESIKKKIRKPNCLEESIGTYHLQLNLI